MTHVTHQRIRKGGKYYAPGDLIELTADEVAALPKGAVSPQSIVVEQAVVNDTSQLPHDDRAARLEAAVAGLLDTDFKKDGSIRADSLKLLGESLGFDVTAEEVTGIRAAKAGGEPT